MLSNPEASLYTLLILNNLSIDEPLFLFSFNFLMEKDILIFSFGFTSVFLYTLIRVGGGKTLTLGN